MDSSSNVFESVEGQFSTPSVFLSDGYTDQAFSHIQDDWTTLSRSNVQPVEATITEVSCDPKILLEKYHSIKDKQKQMDEFHKSYEKELEEVQRFEKKFTQTIFDSLRLFGKNGEDIAMLTGKLSILVKGEVETEIVRLRSLIDENRRQKEKATEEISAYVKLLKECVLTLDEAERHNFENPYLCGICVERNITHVFRPCGHTICQTCLDTQHFWNCHICRKHISDKIKLFFS